MSIKGQNTKSIRKKSLTSSRNPIVGVKNIEFFHQASKGETVIDLSSLNTPAGFSNPSLATLAKARIKDFEENVGLISSSKNTLMKGVSLGFSVVSNATIKLNFEAEEGEIFTGVFNNAVVNGTLIGDVRTPGNSGTLTVGATDYNLGEAVPIDDFSNQYPIILFRDGNRQKRNTGNGATGGNYQMLDNGDGFCSILQFNTVGGGGGEDVEWSSRGALGERPSLSVLQHVDSLHGILEKLTQDSLEEFGYDVTDPTRYSGVPTNIDLKAFGDKVLALENAVDLFQLKTLGADVVGPNSGTLITFNNLVVGKRYEVTAHLNADSVVATASARGLIVHNGVTLRRGSYQNPDGTNTNSMHHTLIAEFTAVVTTVTVDYFLSGASRFNGNGTRDESHATIVEKNKVLDTTQFT